MRFQLATVLIYFANIKKSNKYMSRLKLSARLIKLLKCILYVSCYTYTLFYSGYIFLCFTQIENPGSCNQMSSIDHAIER